MKATVYVTLKQEVLDPQGAAVQRALGSLGFAGVRSVRVGKMIEIESDGRDAEDFSERLQNMAAELLANPVIEDFRVEVEDSKS